MYNNFYLEAIQEEKTYTYGEKDDKNSDLDLAVIGTKEREIKFRKV
jgi:hypothetical protein